VREQAEALAGERGRALERFWADYLARVPTVVLPGDRGGFAAVPDRGGVLPLPLDPDLVDGLAAVARRERATVNMVLLAAWAVLLWKITGVRDQCVAVPVSGRKAGYEDVVGCFVNTVVVRAEVRPDEPFTTFLGDVRRSQLAALAHADLPTDRIVRLVRPNGAAMLAETDFSYYSGVEAITRIGGADWRVEALDVDPAAPAYPIAVSVLEYGADIRAHVKYAADRFRREDVEAWLADFEALLRRLARGDEAESPLALFDSGTPVDAVALPDFRF
jgi:non-ribosomal peptide synthetase component F